jgi:RNA polymerase sigma-70 factor (ECF subfamily)
MGSEGESDSIQRDRSGMEPSDGTLWHRSRGGDSEAFGILFERHAKTIYNFCFRRLGDWAAAEDMLSTVFLEAWRRRDVDLPSEKVLPWLFGIATNVVRNRKRSDGRFSAALRLLSRSAASLRSAELDYDGLADEYAMREVLKLLKRLPNEEQEVLALCVWMGLSYEDAATALGIPVGTVRSRLSRARRRLRELQATAGHKEDGTTSVPGVSKP